MGAMEKYISTKGREDGGAYIMENGLQLCQSVLRLEENVLPGAPFFSIVWFLNPGMIKETKTHVHDFGEYVGFIGTDPDNYKSLNGLIRFYIDGEWLELTESFVAYIPAGVEHCPYEIVRMDRPIIHVAGSDAGTYSKK